MSLGGGWGGDTKGDSATEGSRSVEISSVTPYKASLAGGGEFALDFFLPHFWHAAAAAVVAVATVDAAVPVAGIVSVIALEATGSAFLSRLGPDATAAADDDDAVAAAAADVANAAAVAAELAPAVALEATGAASACFVELSGTECDADASSVEIFLRDGASGSGGMAQFFATFGDECVGLPRVRAVPPLPLPLLLLLLLPPIGRVLAFFAFATTGPGSEASRILLGCAVTRSRSPATADLGCVEIKGGVFRARRLTVAFHCKNTSGTMASWRSVPPVLAEEALPCLLYTSPSPRDRQKSRMPSSA